MLLVGCCLLFVVRCSLCVYCCCLLWFVVVSCELLVVCCCLVRFVELCCLLMVVVFVVRFFLLFGVCGVLSAG